MSLVQGRVGFATTTLLLLFALVMVDSVAARGLRRRRLAELVKLRVPEAGQLLFPPQDQLPPDLNHVRELENIGTVCQERASVTRLFRRSCAIGWTSRALEIATNGNAKLEFLPAAADPARPPARR